MVSSSKDQVVKIGGTSRHPNERMQEINTTGVLFNWVVTEYEFVSDWEKVEKLMHERFAQHRVNNQREFFSVDNRTASKALRELSSSYSENEDDSSQEESWDPEEVKQLAARIREQTKKLVDNQSNHSPPNAQLRQMAELIETNFGLDSPISKQTVEEILDRLETRGAITTELREQMLTDWSQKSGFHSTQSVTPTCSECGTRYTVTMVRYETHTRCPHCRKLSSIEVHWS
jgi:predicted Zn-ribbon and HTH transcriptional regulator